MNPWSIILKNGQTYFNNLAIYTTRLWKYIRPFFNIIHERVKRFSKSFTVLNLWCKIFFMIFNTCYISSFYVRYRTYSEPGKLFKLLPTNCLSVLVGLAIKGLNKIAGFIRLVTLTRKNSSSDSLQGTWYSFNFFICQSFLNENHLPLTLEWKVGKTRKTGRVIQTQNFPNHRLRTVWTGIRTSKIYLLFDIIFYNFEISSWY